MATLEQLRSLFPDAGSDADVIKSAAKEFGINPTQIATEIGYDINKPGFISDIKRGTGQVISAIGSSARDLGLPNAGRSVENYGEDVAFRNPSQINTVGEALSSPLTTIRESIGEVIPQIGTSTAFGLGGRLVGGAIGSLVGPAGTVAGQALGAGAGAYIGNLLQEYGGIRSEQREQGIDNKGRALATGSAAAALDTAFGAEAITNKVLKKGSDILAREAGTSLLKNVAKQGAIGIGEEALTEGLQTGLERYGAQKALTGDEALNEYGLSMIKGGIGGGVVRGGLAAVSGERVPEAGNEIQQAFQQSEQNALEKLKATVVAPANHPDPMARLAELDAIGKGTQARTVEGPDGKAVTIPATEGRFFTPEEQQEYKALKAQLAASSSVETSAPVPPAVTGGTTDIAQQTQAAAAQNQQAQQEQQNQAKREDVFGKVATQYDPAAQSLNIFGQNIEGPRVATFGDRFATVFNMLPPHVQQIAQAITQANKAFATPEKQSPLVSFSFNANNPVASAGKAIEALGKVMTKFQIDHVKSLDEAVQILNKLSTTAKGNQLEQLNAIYEALTGKDTDGFTASQTTKSEKGAKNGQLQLQTTTGLGNVPVEGGTTETNATGTGTVQPGGVQSIGTGSVPEGSLGLQTGQLSGEGIRTGTSTDAGIGNGVSTQTAQVTGAANEQAVQSTVGGGEASGQSQQTGQPNVDQQSVQTGPRTYEPRISFYSTDLSHIASERRIQIISDLLLRVLAPKQERKNTVPAATRAEILRLALLEQFRHADIAEYTGLKTDAVEKQLERMGVKLVDGEFQVIDPEFAVRIVETAAAYRSPEFPDGIGQGELSGLYNTRYEGEEQSAVSLADELQAAEQEGKPGAKLQEELRGTEDGEGKSMGTVSTAGGSQGAVDSEGTAFFAKVEKLQTELEAMAPQDPRRAAKAEQLQKLWADYAKGQEKRRAKGETTVTEEGDENAVQVESADEGNVREPAGGGKAVGKGNAKPKKSAGKSKAKVEPKQEAKPEEVKTPAEQWAVVSALAPELPPYDVLTNSEKSRWDDLVHRGQANLAAAVKIVGEGTQPAGTTLANTKVQTTSANGTTQALTNEPVTIDVESRVIDEKVNSQVAALPAPQIDKLEKHYGLKRDSAEFLAKVQEDITKYVTQGAEAVAGAIRAIIKTMAEGVLAMGIVFNPNITKDAFNINVAKTFQQTIEVTQPVPEAAKAQMSPLAQSVYQAMAPVAMKTGKWFMVADKPNGMLHIFKEDGSHALSDPTLYGKDKGDVLAAVSSLEGGPKITPAGKFTMKESPADYAGGTSLILMESKDYTGYIAVHAADTSTPSEKRLQRLETPTTEDNRISYGCINTKHDTFINKIKPNISKLDGGMIFVLPDAQEQTAQMFAAETRTEERTEGGEGAKGRGAATLVAKEETTPSFNSKSAKFMEFTDLEDEVNGISDVRDQFADMDIEHALDFVSDWQVVNDRSKDAFHGQLKTEQGRYIGVLNLAKMSSPAYAAETARHEIAHAVDMAPHGGVYSHQQEMNVEIKNGKVVPVGEVAKEMFALYENDKAFTRYLEYPFNIEIHTDLDTNGKIESELFAQIFALYTNPKYTDYIASVAPKTAVFMEEVINDIRTTTALQVQKSTTASTRALDFRNRYIARRNQRAAGANGGIGQTTEQPFNKRGQGREFTVDQAISALPKLLQKSTRGVVTNLLHQAKKGLYASAITEDLANMAKKYMPAVSRYLQAQYARQATRLNFEKRIENILAAFDKLPENLKGEGKGSVNEFIHDSTREKKWGYYPGQHQVGTKLFTIDPDFKKRFDAFPPAAQQVIKDVFQHGYDALKLKQQAAENAVNREFDDRIKAAGNDAVLLQQLAKEKKQAIKRITNIRNVQVGDPYAYLGRYGDYVVVAKSKEFIAYEEAAKGTQARVGSNFITGDPQQAKNWLQDNVANPTHYVVQFAETQAEADEIAAQLQATGQYDIQPEDAGVKEANASYFGGSDVHLAVARLHNLAQRQSESTDAKLDKAIADLYLMTVADASARASELQRKNVAGADKNMMRNLATSGRADAHFLASMEHSDEINDSLEAMRDQARNNRREAMPMYNELYTRHANSMDYAPTGDLATALTRMTTLWTLSTNPAFYLQQVLQTSVLSLPYMAGRLGYFRSARAIKRAYGDMSELVKGLGVNEHIDFNKAPADVRNMLNTLVGMGKIDLGIDAEAKARTDEQGMLGKVMLKLQGVNTRIESINRATAAIAAYRGYLERYKNGDTAAATKYAADVVSNTHGSYDGFNTPRVLQGGVGKVALQFKRFQIIQLSMLAKLIHTSFKSASAEEKAVARATLKFITAHMAVLGGALGVPFVSQAAWILSKVFGDDDEPDDFEYKLRRMIGDGPAADLLLRGVPAVIGLESLGKKLSMENVASPFGPFTEPDLTSRAGAEKMLVGLMGPAASIGLKFTDALGMMTKGNYYKGLELALPNGVANVMKSYRFATEGITMRNGDLVMKPEDISLIDAAFQAVGLPTTTITDRQYTQKVVAEFDKFYAQRAGEIKGSYVEASRQSDTAAMAEARDDWQKLQESRVRNGYKRQPMSELFRAPVDARKRERGVVGGVETTKSNRRFVEQVSSVS